MLSDEEKEALEQLRSWREYIIKHKEDVNKANDIEFYLRTAINLIEKQSKELEELKDVQQQICNEELLEQEYVKENFIANDKIKAKIEELKNTHNGDDFNLTNVIMILQSLLEKED